MPLRKENIEKFRNELQARQAILIEDLKKSTAELIEDEPNFADSIDQASADAGKAITVQMKNRERDILTQINEALRRIEDGTFGECVQCAEPIAEARMKANPATTLCIDCKSEIESEQGRFPRRV